MNCTILSSIMITYSRQTAVLLACVTRSFLGDVAGGQKQTPESNILVGVA